MAWETPSRNTVPNWTRIGTSVHLQRGWFGGSCCAIS